MAICRGLPVSEPEEIESCVLILFRGVLLEAYQLFSRIFQFKTSNFISDNATKISNSSYVYDANLSRGA